MVKVSDIKDRDSLRDWLEDLPFDEEENRRIAVNIAHRAAMRVLPVYWDWAVRSDEASENDLTPLPALRACLKSGVFASRPNKKIALAAYDSASGYRGMGYDGVKSAALAATLAADSADGPASLSASASVVAATAPFASKPDGVQLYVALFWAEIRLDCGFLEKGNAILDETPLWSEGNPWSDEWIDVHINLPEGYDFWRDWYQGALDGVKPNWDMLTEIALIDPEDWDKGAAHVNGVIAEIQLKHAVAASPNAEDLIVNDDGLYEVIPRSELPAQTLQDVQGRLGDVIADIRRAQQQENNQYLPLVAEADLLESTLARYPDNSLRLFESCTKVVIHIGRNVSNGVLPENDNLVGDVSGDVQNSADDILNLDAEVRETIEARNKPRFERLSDGQKAEIARLADAVAENSVAPLAAELREDAAVVQGETEPDEDTRPDRYRLGSRLARAVMIGGKNVAEALILVGGVGSGIGIFWVIIRVLLGF